MLDGFAMIRGIEKKYGKVKSFKFIRVRETSFSAVDAHEIYASLFIV